MKAYEIEIYPQDGDVCIAQDRGTTQIEFEGSQFIRVSPDQIEHVVAWLREAKAVAEQARAERTD